MEGHYYGYRMLYKYQETYLSSISKRLAKENEGFDFTDEEVYSMQEMCGFETTVRGSSQWCDVFTQEEWLSFEYARDIIHYYRAGPGNKYAKSMGWLWLNTTANLIAEGPESAGPLYFTLYVIAPTECVAKTNTNNGSQCSRRGYRPYACLSRPL